MPKVIKKNIRFMVSTDVDVVAHRVYVAANPDALDFTSPMAEVPMPEDKVLVPDNFPGFPLRDTDYQIGVTSVDDVGNESDMTVIQHPFDFSAPSAPSQVWVEDA